jgi:DNA-directed RNA polymerase subunit K/omega
LDNYKINPVIVRMKESDKGIIYQSIVAMGFRARQINDQIKFEITERLSTVIDDNPENEGANYDQIAISREFDNIPKPTFIAMKEILEKKLHFTLPSENEEA